MAANVSKLRFCILYLCIGVRMLVAQDESITGCKKGEHATYVRLRDEESGASNRYSDRSDQTIARGTHSLADCAQECTFLNASSRFQCAAFDFDSSRSVDQKCFLFSQTPTKRSSFDSVQLEDTLRQHVSRRSTKPGKNTEAGFFWKICLRGITYCDHSDHKKKEVGLSTLSPYMDAVTFPFMFEQQRDTILLGATEKVLASQSVRHCLQACMESNYAFDFACKSVMYYYDTKQCLLNSAGAAVFADGYSSLVKNDDGFEVDYFEMRHYGYNCGPGTVPQYVLVANAEVVSGVHHEIQQVTKATCAHFCNVNRNDMGEPFSCDAYSYKADEKLCYLLDENTSHKSAANITESAGVMTFEKVCLSAAQTCTMTPAFQRSPNRVLTGFAQVIVENIRSDEACLSECLRATEAHGFDCMSSMYYYDSRECILNFETKISKGVSEFFGNSTENFNVDYYDNLCQIRKRDAGIRLNSCSERATSTFIRYNSSRLAPQYYVVSYEGIRFVECLIRCNQADNFTCNSIDYRLTERKCSLSYVDSRTTSLSAASSNANVSHYDRVCVEGARLACGSDDAVSFEALPNARLSADYLIVAFSGIGPEECLSLCLLDPSSRCRSVNYEPLTSLCHLNNATRNQALLADVSDEHSLVIYYENLCHREDLAIVAETFGAVDWTQIDIHKMPGVLLEDAANETLGPATQGPAVSSGSKLPSLDVKPMCEYSNMRVRMTAERPFDGYMFAKNKFGTCRIDVDNRNEAVLSLPFPDVSRPESPCGVQEITRSKYSALVIVTSKNMGIPGLVTEHDRFFNVTCDFANSISNTVTATGRSMSVNNPKDTPELHPDGVVVIPAPLTMQLSKPGATAVKTATLGEQLNMDFHYYAGFNRTGMGLFVRQCNASRYFGPPPAPAPLILIDDGCPTDAVRGKIIGGAVAETTNGFTVPFTVFRFDGSNSVKITCAIDLCEGGCHPTQCNLNGQQVTSYGKRRKRNHASDTTNPGHKKSDTSSVIFTVIDKMQRILPSLEPDVNNADKLQRLQYRGSNYGPGFVEQFVSSDSEKRRDVCMKKSTFLGVFIFLSAICLFQIVVIAAYVAHQFLNTKPQKIAQ